MMMYRYVNDRMQCISAHFERLYRLAGVRAWCSCRHITTSVLVGHVQDCDVDTSNVVGYGESDACVTFMVMNFITSTSKYHSTTTYYQ